MKASQDILCRGLMALALIVDAGLPLTMDDVMGGYGPATPPPLADALEALRQMLDTQVADWLYAELQHAMDQDASSQAADDRIPT
jgi:hypothetical protein